MRICIVTDSTACLPADLRQRYAISVVPLNVHIDGRVYREGEDLSAAEFYPMLEAATDLPTTSQPSPGDFVHVWEPLVDAGYTVLSIHISGGISGTVQNAQAAAKVFGKGKIVVIDSRSTAMGLGMMVIAAAQKAEAGASLEEIVAVVERMKAAMQHWFVVDTLTYLAKGGRIGGAAAFLGSVLSIKPLLTLQDGVIDALEKVRTKRRAVERMVELMREALGDDPAPWISVVHARVPAEAEQLLATVNRLYPRGPRYMTELGPVIGTHTGPGCLAIIACPSSAVEG